MRDFLLVLAGLSVGLVLGCKYGHTAGYFQCMRYYAEVFRRGEIPEEFKK